MFKKYDKKLKYLRRNINLRIVKLYNNIKFKTDYCDITQKNIQTNLKFSRFLLAMIYNIFKKVNQYQIIKYLLKKMKNY